MFVAADSNEIRVTGFGVVPALEALGIKAPVRRPYSAPERANGDAWDERADVFSLGCILFECLTGRAAFRGEHVMAVLTKVLFEDPPALSELVPEAVARRFREMFPNGRPGAPLSPQE